MDRIALILFLLFTSAVSAQGNQDGRFEIRQNTWRGTVEENKQQFNTIRDTGNNNNNAITLLVDRHPDKRVSGYMLFYGTESGVYTMTHNCKKTLETGCTVRGLTNGTTYYFVAVAYGLNPAITSSYSNEVSGAP